MSSLRRTLTLFGGFAGLRFVTQILAFLSGILVVRLLPTTEYAYFALASSLLSAIAVLSASGVSSRLISTVARLPRPSEEANAAYSAAMRVRTGNLFIVSAVGLPFLAFLLLANGAPVSTAALTVIAVGLATVPALNIGIFTVELEVGRRFARIALGDLSAAAIRLALIGASAASGLLWAPVLLASGVISSTWQSSFVRRAARKTIALPPGFNAARTRQFRKAVAQTLPATLLMIVGEQSVNLMLTLAGNLEGIAQNSALSRFSVAFTLVNSVMGTLGASWISRAAGGRRLIRTAGVYVLSYGAISVFFVVVVATFKEQLLLILGAQYSGLAHELMIVTIGAAVANFASYGLGVVNHARGWLSYSWTYAPGLAAWAIFAWLAIDRTTHLGAAVLLASLSLPLLLTQLVRLGGGVLSGGQRGLD